MGAEDASPAGAAAHGAVADPAARLDVASRLAVLEDRTRARPKSLLENLKDWGGIASLVVALAYSFPLGLWDRFVLSPQQRAAAELNDLRAVIEELTRLMSEGAFQVASIGDAQWQDTARRALHTRAYMKMLRYRERFLEAAPRLTPTELAVAAHHFLQAEQLDAAATLASAVIDHAQATLAVRIEAHRVLAKLGPLRGGEPGWAAMRAHFHAALALAAGGSRWQAVQQDVALRSEWAMIELTDGDWECGRTQLESARAAYAVHFNLFNDGGAFMRMVEQRTSMLAPRPDQSSRGCPA